MIHQFFMQGIYFVLDVHSGAVHVVDHLLYRLVALVGDQLAPACPQEICRALESEGFAHEDIAECYEELLELKQNGLLFCEDSYRPYAEQLGLAPVKSMCLNVAHDCNLRCEYCFAAQGDFGGGRCLMSFETGKTALDFLIKNSGSRHNLEVDFFGGEPLMNLAVVKQLVQYARSIEEKHNKNFRFTITTNGLLLNEETIRFINNEMANVVLSLDGRKEVNDRLRYTNNGSGSYDNIVPKYQALVSARGDKDHYIRGTFTRYNLDFTQDVLHMLALGFRQLSIEPAVMTADVPYALREEDLPQINAEYEKLAQTIYARKKEGEQFNFFHFLLDLEQGPCAIKRLRGCSCGNEYLAVTPQGEIYPCHQFVGDENWKMGNVLDGSVDMLKKQYFSNTHIYKKPTCETCWAKFYCSGGCNANNYQFNKDVLQPHTLSCEMEKKRLECAIWLQAALQS